MAAEQPSSDPPVASRWWYWIAAYPIVAVLSIPVIIALVILFFAPIAMIDATVGDPAAPLALVFLLFVGMLGLAFFLLALAVFVMLPVALYFDAKEVELAEVEWEPDPFVYAIIATLQFFVTPVIGFIVAIYYLYRRHTDVGVP